ncbi:hypothetical protein BKA56DRAFT_625265 [Ilyonectria sp. MPI-CAGE-AT-0026]|nr:hypothetical protein BKA56DRAFT_625265 [Ilyonectria sp. MPI-CAGE-AT-0026]
MPVDCLRWTLLSRTPSDRESSIAATIETASEIPDRQILPSVESSTSTTPKRKRITTADATWQHTRKPQGSEPERWAKARLSVLLQILQQPTVLHILVYHIPQPPP